MLRLLVLLLFTNILITFSASGADEAAVSLNPPKQGPVGKGYERRACEAVFLLGASDNYAVHWQGGINTVDPQKPFTPGTGDYCMGMNGPVGTGWFCSGFLNLIINGQEASTTVASSMNVAEEGRRAIVDTVWHLDAADARVRMLGLPGGDCLFCEIAIEPKRTIESLEFKTLCFPAYFTAFYGNREQARFVETPSRRIRELDARHANTLSPADNWWMLFGDEYFDVAKTRESDGPCAVMFLPEAIASVKLAPLAYGVTTIFSAVPKARTVRMVFWKLKGKTNTASAAYFRDQGETIRRQLAAMDFTPKTIATFSLKDIATDLEKLAQPKGVGGECQQKAKELLDIVKIHNADLMVIGDGINATEQKLKLAARYAGFRYEARIVELLKSLDNAN